MSESRTQQLLSLLHAGHPSAVDSLFEHSITRFRLLARRMLRRGSLRQLEETDDILQKAMIRLFRALERVKPADGRALVGLAARQIRWVLCDLAKETAARIVKYDVKLNESAVDGEGEPADLLRWTDFHDAIEGLPSEEREVAELIIYQGLTQPEVADALCISLRTVKRRWQGARLNLWNACNGEWPNVDE